MRARAALRHLKDGFREPVHVVERWVESVGARLTCQSVPLTSIDRWAVKAGDFDAPFAVQGGVCVVTCHLNAQENSLHRIISWLFPRKKSGFSDFSWR